MSEQHLDRLALVKPAGCIYGLRASLLLGLSPCPETTTSFASSPARLAWTPRKPRYRHAHDVTVATTWKWLSRHDCLAWIGCLVGMRWLIMNRSATKSLGTLFSRHTTCRSLPRIARIGTDLHILDILGSLLLTNLPLSALRWSLVLMATSHESSKLFRCLTCAIPGRPGFHRVH